MALAISCACVSACGGGAKPADTARADAPAVVKLPPPVLASDTLKPDTMESHVQRMSMVRGTLAGNYAVLGAAITFGDRRMIASFYTPDAMLSTPDSTYRGVAPIANALAALGPPKSMRAFNRMSVVLRVVDSTVIDSGTYSIVSARQGIDSIVEHGTYMSRWRINPAPMSWTLTSDRLLRERGKASKRR